MKSQTAQSERKHEETSDGQTGTPYPLLAPRPGPYLGVDAIARLVQRDRFAPIVVAAEIGYFLASAQDVSGFISSLERAGVGVGAVRPALHAGPRRTAREKECDILFTVQDGTFLTEKSFPRFLRRNPHAIVLVRFDSGRLLAPAQSVVALITALEKGGEDIRDVSCFTEDGRGLSR